MTPAEPLAPEPDSQPLAMCSICHEDIDCHGVVLRDCRHKFHRSCIDRWVLRNNSCPFCRAERPQIVSMPKYKCLRYSSVIDTHVFPKMKVWRITKNYDDKYTLTLLVTDEVFWQKMDEFDSKMCNTFIANPQWFQNEKYRENFMNISVKGRDSGDGTRGYIRVKVFAPRKDFLTACGTEVGTEVEGDFLGQTTILFDRTQELHATCTVQSKIWMRSRNNYDLGGVVFQVTDLEMSYKAKLNPPPPRN